MPILLGHCQEVGHVDRLEIAVPDHTVQTGNCPLCGQVQTCDVHWREDVFNPSDMDIIRNQEDMSPNHNVYPGGTPGRFHHHLVIFVDHPDFTFEGLEDLLRRRIRQHNNWDTHAVHSLCVLDQAVHDHQDGHQAFPPDGGTLAVARAHLCAHHSVPNDEFLVVDPHHLTVLLSSAMSCVCRLILYSSV